MTANDVPRIDGDVPWMGKKGELHDERLRAALLDASRRLGDLKRARGALAERDPTVLACETCIKRAVVEAQRGAHFVAWDELNQFDDEMIAVMDPIQLRARWATLRAEADVKLSGWRAKAASSLAADVDATQPPVPVVRELHDHLATTAQNKHFMLGMLQRTMVVIAWYLWLVVIALVGLALCSLWFGGCIISEASSRTLLLGVSAGALGGLLSLAFWQLRADLKGNIPELKLSIAVTLMRPALGAAIATPVLVLIESDFIKLAGMDKSWAIFAFCFLAGYSEHWFLGLVERFGAERK